MRDILRRSERDMTASLFFRLLKVQVAIVVMGSVNAIADGIVAARFIDADTVGVVGLFSPCFGCWRRRARYCWAACL